MRVAIKGLVTMLRDIREVIGIPLETGINFVEYGDRFCIVKSDEFRSTGTFTKLRGIASVKMSTDEIMSLTRKS